MKNNDIIAKFMLGEIISEEKYEMPHGSNSEVIINNWKIPIGIPYDHNLAKIGNFFYDVDWNWLMPVIDKIENLNFIFEINKNSCIIKKLIKGKYEGFIFNKEKKKINAVYKSIVQFINFYQKAANEYGDDFKNSQFIDNYQPAANIYGEDFKNSQLNK